jgi:hypothetical protein
MTQVDWDTFINAVCEQNDNNDLANWTSFELELYDIACKGGEDEQLNTIAAYKREHDRLAALGIARTALEDVDFEELTLTIEELFGELD